MANEEAEDEGVPLVRLLSMAVSVALEELHEALARSGHPSLRPAHGYVLNAVLNGRDTASSIAPLLGMTKQGAARLVQQLVDDGYLTYDSDTADARRKPLRLTSRGREVVDLSVAVQRGIEKRWAASGRPGDMASARALLEGAVTHGGAGDYPPVRLGW